jgi:hypothetical protein
MGLVVACGAESAEPDQPETKTVETLPEGELQVVTAEESALVARMAAQGEVAEIRLTKHGEAFTLSVRTDSATHADLRTNKDNNGLEGQLGGVAFPAGNSPDEHLFWEKLPAQTRELFAKVRKAVGALPEGSVAPVAKNKINTLLALSEMVGEKTGEVSSAQCRRKGRACIIFLNQCCGYCCGLDARCNRNGEWCI